jgi:hypothetical protein
VTRQERRLAWLDSNTTGFCGPLYLKRTVGPTAFDPKGFDPEKKHDVMSAKPRIRCPHCKWQPKRSSRWFCLPMGAPENFDGGCGHSWNTFDTRGRCPTCQHQWKFTSCLQCEATSPHDDWYEAEDKKPT